MAFCPQCGTSNPDDAVFCTNCGVKIPKVVSEMTSTATTPQSLSQPQQQIPSGQPAGYATSQPMQVPGAVAATPQVPYPQMMGLPRKDPALAAIISFFIPGLGHIYAGKVGKGIAILIGSVISFFLMILLIPILIAIALWIYGIIDSYKTAERYNLFVAANGRPPMSTDNW